MSASKQWRSGLDLAKAIINAKKSVHSTLFEQIDLTRFVDDEYLNKLNDRNELSGSLSFDKTDDINAERIAEEEEISSFWQYDKDKDIEHQILCLSHFLISQSNSVCRGNIKESLTFKRRLLLQRIILSQTDDTHTLLTNKTSPNNVQSLENTQSFVSLPFEAQIGIKLLLSTLDSIDVTQDQLFSSKLIQSLLPHLNHFIITLSTHKTHVNPHDFGVLNRICHFLCAMLNVNDTNQDILSPILCTILSLSILSNDLNRIIYVIHRILTHSSCQDLKLSAYQSLHMINMMESHASNSKNDSNKHSPSSHFVGGSLYCFGKGEYGRLGVGQSPTHKDRNRTEPTISPKFNADNCTEISCFSSHNLCIDTEGHVYSWGKGEHGRLGDGQNKSTDIPRLIEPLRSFKVAHVAVGLSHSLVLTEDGNVWSFGSGEHGRLGHGESAEFRSPKVIETLKDMHMVHISCGAYHSCAIASNGSLFTWGKNDQGQCGLGSVANKDVMVPTNVTLDDGNGQIGKAAYCDSGWEHTLLITRDGICMSWGRGYEGHRPVLGHGTEKPQYAPKRIEALSNVRVVDVACGWDHSLCVADDGTLYTWGDHTNGKLGHAMNSHQNVPKIVNYFSENGLKAVFCKGGSNHSAVITSDGSLFMFGNGSDYQLGQGSGHSSQKNIPTKVAKFDSIAPISKVGLGDKYTMCITGRPSQNGHLYPLGGLLGRRASLMGLERRRSSLFSSTDMSIFRGMDDTNEELLITYDDRLVREQYKIYDDEDEDSKSVELVATDKKDTKSADAVDKDQTKTENDDSTQKEEAVQKDTTDEEKDTPKAETVMKREEAKEEKVFDAHTTATILLAHLDRICGETDFCTVDDPAKELRKLQNDPSLIQTNSLIKRKCHAESLQHLFEIVEYFIDALCKYKQQGGMSQIEEQKAEQDCKEAKEVIEYEDKSITYSYFILSCLRLLRSKVRIAALIYKEDKEQFEQSMGAFDFNHLQKSLLQFMGENTGNEESVKPLQNMDQRIHRLIQFEATALLSAGIELFYPSHSTRIGLVNTLLDGTASSVFTQALLAQFSQPALLQGFLPAMVVIEDVSKKDEVHSIDTIGKAEVTVSVDAEARDIRDDTAESMEEEKGKEVKEEVVEEDDDREYKIDAAKLLDLLSILMKRSHIESLRMIDTNKSPGLSSTTAFLSCLQRESLIWITKRLTNNQSMEEQWIAILGEHANDLCQTSMDLCRKMMDNVVQLIRHLKYSIVGSILPSYLFALGCMNFVDHIGGLRDHLMSLLLQLDKIYVLCHADKELEDRKYEWLVTLENIIASLITKGLSPKLLLLSTPQEDAVNYRTLLNSPLLYHGIQAKDASWMSDDHKKKDDDEYDERNSDQRREEKKMNAYQFIHDLMNGENEAKILCNWLHTNSKQNRIIPSINDDLYRVIRTTFTSYLYLSNSLYEAFVYARLIKAKGLPRSEIDIAPPPELIVLWNQSLGVGQDAYFKRRALLKDVDPSGMPSCEDKPKDKDMAVKQLLDGYEARAFFLLRVHKPESTETTDDTLNALDLTPSKAISSTKTMSHWKSLRTRVRVIAHWKALLVERSTMNTEQRSYYRQIKQFVCKPTIDLSRIEEIIVNRDTLATKRYEGLQQIRELLSSVSCPSAKQEILKSIFILYDSIQKASPSAQDTLQRKGQPMDGIQSVSGLVSRVNHIIPPILHGLQSASNDTMQDISYIFHLILQDTTAILSDETYHMSLRAAALGIWSMEIGAFDANELYSKTDIFSTLCDILSAHNASNDSLRMYVWSFFCLLLKQVIASNNHTQYISAIDVLKQQIQAYETLIMNHDSNPSFPESVTLIHHAKLDRIHEGYKFVLGRDMVKRYVSQHGYIPDELKRTLPKSILSLLPKQQPAPIPTPPRNIKKELIVKPSRYSGYKYLSDLRYYTIGFWIKLYDTDATNPMQTIVLRGTHSPKIVNPIIYLNKSDRRIHVEITVSTIGAERLQSDQSLNLREWTHVLLIVRPDGTSLQKSLIELYINGTLDTKKQTGYVKGPITSHTPIYVGRVPKPAYNDASNRGGANGLIMNVTMFLYPISDTQVTEFYEHCLKQSLCYVTMNNFEIALNILKSQTLSLNGCLQIKRWLPVKEIIVPLFNILKQLTDDRINNSICFDEQTVIRIMDQMEWILLMCTPKAVENLLPIDHCSELIQFILDIVSHSLSTHSNSNRWYRRMAIGDRSILFIRRLLQHQDWQEVVSSHMEKYMSSTIACQLHRNEIHNVVMALSLFGGNRMVFRSETQIQFVSSKAKNTSDGVITKYDPNMTTARFIPFVANEKLSPTTKKLCTLIPTPNYDTLPYLAQHYDDMVAPLVNVLVSYQKAMKEWLSTPDPPEEEMKEDVQAEEKQTLNILQNVHHILAMTVPICKTVSSEFEPHSKYPIPVSIQARMARETEMKQEEDEKDTSKEKEGSNETPENIEQVDALLESLSHHVMAEIDTNESDETQHNSILEQTEIDYDDYDERTLLSSNILVQILRLFKLFRDDSDEHNTLMSSISSHPDLMKSLLFLASLPIQFDQPSNCIELEQLHTNITMFIEYYRMKHWIETHDYYQYQLKLQKEYKRKVNEYKEWLKEHRLKLIQQEEKKKEEEANAKDTEAQEETQTEEQKQDKDKETKEQDTEETEQTEQKEDKDEKQDDKATETIDNEEEVVAIEKEHKTENEREQKESNNEISAHSLMLDANDSSFKVLSPQIGLILNDAEDNIVVLGDEQDEEDEDTEDDEMGMTYLDPHDAIIGMVGSQEASGVDFLSDLSQDQQIPMAQLISMGFSAGVARQCLEITNFNINQAIELAANINNDEEQMQFEEAADLEDMSSQMQHEIPSIQPQLGSKPQLKLLADYNANDSGIDIDMDMDANIQNLMMMDDESLPPATDSITAADVSPDKAPVAPAPLPFKATKRPRPLEKLKIKTAEAMCSENEYREKIANNAKKELMALMSPLPDVSDDAIPDATSNETATKPFDLCYFPKYVAVEEAAEDERSTSIASGSGLNLQSVFDDILGAKYPLPGLLRLLSLVNLGLSIHYSRDIVESMFLSQSVDGAEMSDFYRFLKLYVFRSKNETLLKRLMVDCTSLMRGQLIDCAIIEVRTAAQNIHKYNSYEWGFRDVSASDVEVLSEARIELSLALLNEFVDALSLEQFRRMNVCLRSANMALKCHLFTIISKRLLSLDDDYAQWIGCLAVGGLEHLARARYKTETVTSNRLLKSQYLTQLLELVVIAKSIEDRIVRLSYREDRRAPMDDISIFVVDVSSRSICIGWKTARNANKLWPNCFMLQMRDANKEWKTLMKGNARQWVINKGLSPRKAYYFRMRAQMDEICGEWSSSVSVRTLPDMIWKKRTHCQYFNGSTRVVLQSGGDRWRTIRANKGFNCGVGLWTIKIFKSDRSFVFVGVCSGSANADTFCGGDQYGFGYFLQDRYRYHNRGKISAERVASSHRFKGGDEMRFKLDFATQTLSMAVNGSASQELFCGCFDSTEHWFPCVSLYHRGDGIEFVGDAAAAAADAAKELEYKEVDKMEAFEQTLVHFSDTFWLAKALSGNGSYPADLLNVAYSEWKSWFNDTVRVIETMDGTLFIDVDAAKCSQYLNGHCANDLVQYNARNIKLLGLVCSDDDDEYREFYYVEEGQTDGRCGSIETFASICSSKRRKEISICANDIDSYEVFVSNVCCCDTWRMDVDCRLLRIVSDAACALDVSLWSLLRWDLQNCSDSFALMLPDIGLSALTQRFIVFKLLNRSLSFVLPFVCLSFESSLCCNLMCIRALISSDLKNDLLEKVIASTTTFTAPNDDPYEDPPHLKQVTINRHKARAHGASLHHSIFHQLYLQLKYLDCADLRRNYAAKLDDGQERTFKVKFFGEGVQDNGGPYRETFHELMDEVLNEDHVLPLFIQHDSLSYIPNPSCAEFDFYRFFGRVIGICIRNHILINANLSGVVWKQLINNNNCCTKQITAIRHGLSSIIPLHLLPIYTHKELQDKICGKSDFSCELLKSITVYEGHLSPSSYHVSMFWNMMQSFNAEQKEMFLRFTWAKTRIPNKKSLFGGNTFKLQPYAVKQSQNVDVLLPRSHTCFFSLQLPSYSSLQIMKQRFLYAMYNTASMDRDLKLQDSELYNYQQLDD
eukprot:207667_1